MIDAILDDDVPTEEEYAVITWFASVGSRPRYPAVGQRVIAWGLLTIRDNRTHEVLSEGRRFLGETVYAGAKKFDIEMQVSASGHQYAEAKVEHWERLTNPYPPSVIAAEASKP